MKLHPQSAALSPRPAAADSTSEGSTTPRETKTEAVGARSTPPTSPAKGPVTPQPKRPARVLSRARSFSAGSPPIRTLVVPPSGTGSFTIRADGVGMLHQADGPKTFTNLASAWAQYSPDETLLACAGPGGKVFLIDAGGGPVREWSLGSFGRARAAWLSNDTLACARGQTFQIVQLKPPSRRPTMQVQREFHADIVALSAVPQTGHTAVGLTTGEGVLIDRTGAERGRFPFDSGEIKVSPDGRYVATRANGVNLITLNEQPVRVERLPLMSQGSPSIHFSPDSGRVVVAGQAFGQGTLDAFPCDSPNENTIHMQGEFRPLREGRVSADGGYLALFANDQTLQIRQMAAPKISITTFAEVDGFAWGPSASLGIVQRPGQFQRIDFSGPKPKVTYEEPLPGYPEAAPLGAAKVKWQANLVAIAITEQVWQIRLT